MVLNLDHGRCTSAKLNGFSPTTSNNVCVCVYMFVLYAWRVSKCSVVPEFYICNLRRSRVYVCLCARFPNVMRLQLNVLGCRKRVAVEASVSTTATTSGRHPVQHER